MYIGRYAYILSIEQNILQVEFFRFRIGCRLSGFKGKSDSEYAHINFLMADNWTGTYILFSYISNNLPSEV
jgi:hypothetical protein